VSLQRIGLFGGAFDPPHRAHMALAQAALQQLGLDCLHIIPTGQAWHKSRSLSAAEHRLAMCRLAFAGLANAVVDNRETQRVGPSFTLDTLREMQAQYPDAQLYLVLGEDQATALPSWHQWELVVKTAIICVAVRASNTGASGQFDALMTQIPRLQALHMEPVLLSATDIRKQLASRQSVDALVFEPVARYIEQHHLYEPA
jgi:nicotinate-nucleotide adenylyltransferase